MEVVIVVLVVIAALLVIASGVWVAIALVSAVSKRKPRVKRGAKYLAPSFTGGSAQCHANDKNSDEGIL